MSNRWLRRSRSQRGDNTPPTLTAQMSVAFLEMERRLEATQHAVEVAFAVGHCPPSLTAEWVAARERAYAATAAYLAATSPSSFSASHHPSSADVGQAITAATSGLDSFYNQHRQVLDKALAAAVAARAAANESLALAAEALRRWTGLDAELAKYESVRSAHALVEAGCSAVQSALSRGDVSATHGATQRLRSAAASLDGAVAAAPRVDEQAHRTLASVQTRLAATSHRADTAATALTSLLREFHGDSSADLLSNVSDGRQRIVGAEALLIQAETVLSDRQPEQAAALAGHARDELRCAAELIDAVTERLKTLRALRADPLEPERDARFRIRDAQRLALDCGAVPEWGTVLDAQVARVDRAVAALSVRHPDYWQYHLALEEVSHFVSTVVTRIRQQAAAQ